jgi:hypothetical protein
MKNSLMVNGWKTWTVCFQFVFSLRFDGTMPLFLFIFIFLHNIHTFIQSQYIHPSPFAEASLHFLIACMLSGDNLPVVPSRESNSGLPYIKPTRCQLSRPAPLCSVCVQFVFSLCSVCVQFVFSLFSFRVQFVFSSFSVCVQFVFSLCSVRVQFVFSSFSACVQFVFSLCSVRVQFVFSLCSVCVQFVFNSCSVCVQFYGHDQAKEGWPLLTVETEVNGDSKKTNERGPFLVGLLGLSNRNNEFLFCLGCSSRPIKKYFFLTIHYFNSFVPIAQQAGQATVLGHQSLSVCLKPWSLYTLQILIRFQESLFLI